MGLITASTIKGLQAIGFGKGDKVNQGNLTFPYEEGYIYSSDVYAVTSKIARNGKKIEWILKTEINGEIETVTEGELYDLIQKPNEEQTRAEFVEMALLFLLLSGEVFQRGLFSDILVQNQLLAVDLLNPQLVTIDIDNKGSKYYAKSYRYVNDKTIDVNSVEHLKYANPTMQGTRSLRGLSPLVAGFLTLTGLINNQQANASILKNQGAAGILSNEGEYTLKGDEQEQQQGVLDRLLSGILKTGKILQAATKIRYTKLGLDPTQLKIIESKLLKFRDLCTIYDVKSILFNDPMNASFRNLELAEVSFYENAVIPNTQLIVNMFSNSVVKHFNEKDFANKKGKYFIELDISSIAALQDDLKKEAQKDKIKMDGVNVLLNMPITTAGKVELLISEYGYSEENAKKIAAPAPKSNEE